MTDQKPTTDEAGVSAASIDAKVNDSTTSSKPVADVTGDGAADDSKLSTKDDTKIDTKDDSKIDTKDDSNAVSADDSKAKQDEDAKADTEKKEETGGRAAQDDRNKRSPNKGHHSRGGRSGNGYSRGGYSRDNKRFDKPKYASTEFDNLPETDDPVLIREQVEFYFSDQNLRSDEHMFMTIQGARNQPMPIKNLCNFKRMRRFQPYSAVVEALRHSELLEVVDDGRYSGVGNEAVKRKVPLKVEGLEVEGQESDTLEAQWNRIFRTALNKMEACIYAKGFGDPNEAKQIDLENFFKPYGAIMVRKRRNQDDNSWKGSVFVEFKTTEDQEQFLALDPKPKFNGNELTIMSKKAYSEMKCKEKGIVPEWLREKGSGDNKRRYEGQGNPRGRGRYPSRGGRGNDRGRGTDRGRGNHWRDNNGRRDNDRRRNRSRSPKSRDDRDWNDRRDKFQNSKDFEHGSNGRDKKRKAEGEDREESKKSKVEIKEDA